MSPSACRVIFSEAANGFPLCDDHHTGNTLDSYILLLFVRARGPCRDYYRYIVAYTHSLVGQQLRHAKSHATACLTSFHVKTRGQAVLGKVGAAHASSFSTVFFCARGWPAACLLSGSVCNSVTQAIASPYAVLSCFGCPSFTGPNQQSPRLPCIYPVRLCACYPCTFSIVVTTTIHIRCLCSSRFSSVHGDGSRESDRGAYLF